MTRKDYARMFGVALNEARFGVRIRAEIGLGPQAEDCVTPPSGLTPWPSSSIVAT